MSAVAEKRHGPDYRASIATKECEAGCGRTVRERRRRFCSNSCAAKARTGATAARYTGGLFQDRTQGDRWYITCRDGTSYAFYRAVVSAELGRLLRPDEHVHHLNGDPTDDRLENLRVVSQSEHTAIHSRAMTAAREAKRA